MEQKIDERLQKAAMEYYPTISPRTLGDNNVMAENFKQSYMRDAFIAGDQWHRNSIWHDVNKEPIPINFIDEMFLILEYDNIYLCKWHGDFFNDDNGYCEHHNYKWCRINDILPTKD